MLRSFFTVSGFTLLSRVLGVVRDMIISSYLGRGWISDAYYRAFAFPNMFRRIFGEGAFNAAFVPLFSKKIETEGKEDAHKFAQISFSWLCLMLLLSSVFAMTNMRFIIETWLPFLENDEAVTITVKYAFICFPYLMCIALAANLSGVLNSLKHFGASAFAPVLLNLVLIGGLSTVVPFNDWFGENEQQKINSGYVAAFCVLIAGALQLLMLWWMARRAGFTLVPFSFKWNLDMRRLFILMGPGVLTAGVQQINLLLSQTIASQKDGVTSLIYNADRINQLPLGVIGIAVGVVLLPEVSRAVSQNNHQLASDKMHAALEFSMSLVLPSAAAFMVIAEPICQLIFVRGNYTPEDGLLTAHTLAAFAIGLPAYVLAKVLQVGYFARENTRTPMFFSIAVVVINLLLAFWWFPKMEHIGLALATSVAAWINIVLLYLGLRKNFKIQGWVVLRLLMMMLSSGVMAGVLFWMKNTLAFYSSGGVFKQLLSLGFMIIIGAGVYFGMCLATKATSIERLKSGLKRS